MNMLFNRNNNVSTNPGVTKSTEAATSVENTSHNQSFNSMCVADFKNKMVNSFELCQLWPINEEAYEQFEAKAKLLKDKFKVSTSIILIL